MIVVADTSVLLNPAFVRQADLLAALFAEIWVPPMAKAEFHRLAESAGRFSGLAFPSWIRMRSPDSIPAQLKDDPGLHPGEEHALAPAVQIGAGVVLMDDGHGRAVALAPGLKPIGVPGVLAEAKRRRLIARIAPVIDTLRDDAGFRASDQLIEQVLRADGEG